MADGQKFRLVLDMQVEITDPAAVLAADMHWTRDEAGDPAMMNVPADEALFMIAQRAVFEAVDATGGARCWSGSGFRFPVASDGSVAGVILPDFPPLPD